MTYSWLIYSYLFFGSSILCDRQLPRRPSSSFFSGDNDDMFYCSNGLDIEWSLVCDGHKDCSDGLDETKELCARYEYGTNMSMDCGTVSNESKKEHVLKETPWIVDIYEIHTLFYYHYHLGLGSIISPNLVVASAYIFRQQNDIILMENSSNNISKSYNLFKIDIPLQTDNENNHYYIDAKMIYLNSKASTFPYHKSAVIVLANTISFSNGVTPVCIDWYGKYNVRNGAYGKLNGFMTNSKHKHTVLQRFFRHIDNSSCYIFGKSSDYCIKLQFATGEVKGFTFQSLSLFHSNSYFLTGISGNSFWNGIDITAAYLDFIDVQYYVPWIRGILNKHSTANSCVLPTVEGVVHSYEGSNSILSPGTLINPYTTVIENCQVGYHKAHQNGFRVCQRYGIWKTNSDKLCLKMCPPLLSDSLDITCRYNSTYANCSNLSIPNTIATPKCKHGYALPNGQKETTIELQCQSNGTWNNELYICEPYCGRPFVKAQILIKNGETANVGTAPWNVAIYKKISDYEFICGGSIISRNLVVSAAHCFWKKGTLCNVTIFDGLYKIAAGKYYRNFTINENEFPQMINVDRIHLKEGYFGVYGYYAEDIAVVVLQKSVYFSNGITPICVDWHRNYNVPNGAEGQIVGWGKTETEVESPILLKTSLPYINLTTCRDMYKNGFQSYLTPDKFCAGSPLVFGKGVELGDSGSGLCFSHSKITLVFYLTGVASLKEQETNNSITLFTSVRYHITWISELYTHYKKVQYN